jgi:FtsP/CotA-like multicopper oxidase with cupredoxin domain
MNRRSFVSSVGAVVANQLAGSLLPAQVKKPSGGAQHKRADYTLRIESCTIEISPGVNIKTIGYNGQIPGPILRLKEGVPVNIDVLNKTGNADLVHWHGLAIDPLNDGAMEEGSPMIPAGGQHRYSFTPKPAGTRWYHTHNSAGANLSVGGYTGQFGFLLVEGEGDPGQYDQEVFLAVHHWEPSFVPMVEMMQAQSANNPKNPGSDVGYKYATINQHRLGAGEPLRVKLGQRVLMRILNASATENIVIALPGHKFKVVAMDGNPVPTPKAVPVLAIAAAERIDAVVEMNSPGVWVLGSTLEQSRTMGLGVVVEYAGQKGSAVWKDPEDTYWDYTQFGSDKPSPKPDETIRLIFNDIGPSKIDPRFDAWAINKKSWPDIEPIRVTEGKRYRLSFLNASGDQHPMHLHRHSFEVTRVGHQDVSGLLKDVINVMPLQTVNVDFIADNPGDSLLHCHMQLHMDFGFMQLIKYNS